MFYKEIDELIEKWQVGYKEVFDIRFGFTDPGVLIILRKKEDLFVVDEDKSTHKLEPWNTEQIKKALANGTLEPKKGGSVNVNYREDRTGGCECGAWATQFPDCHAFWCRKYRKW